MIADAAQIAGTVLFAFTLAAIIYWARSPALLRRWLKDTAPQPLLDEPPPVTFLRPLKRDSPRVAECVESLIRASLEGDQVIFGVDPGSPAATICAEAAARCAGREIVIIECAPGVAVNPKISKLLQMTAHARHEHLIVSDSEALMDAKFTRAVREEWRSSGADLLTAGYRFVGLKTWAQQLDAAATLLTLWPGLAWLRRFSRARLTLGACTALRRRDLDAVGGWATFAHDLAEDHRLGQAVAAHGRKVRLSSHVVTLASDALSWRDYWRHQRRVAVTYRVANPVGFAGSMITHSPVLFVVLAFITSCSQPFAIKSAVFSFLVAWIARWSAARTASALLAFPLPRLGRVVLIVSLVETACWFLSWFSRRVWWGGRWRRVDWRGKLRE